MTIIKNIIFDLNGVLFESYKLPTGELGAVEPIPAGIDLLHRLHQKKQNSSERICKLFVCSNYKAPVFEQLQRDFAEIFSLFDGLVHATLAQARKPDPRMFQFLFDRYEIHPHESLLLDDQIQNIDSAKLLGMHAVHVTDFDEVEKSLRKLKLL